MLKDHVDGISVGCIHDEAQFRAAADEWNALVRRSRADSVFLRHEWFDSAWRWLRKAARLHLLSVYRGGALIGVCPLIFRLRRQGGMRLRSLEFLAVPDTQACDIIAAPRDYAEVTTAIARVLHESRQEWDMVDLRPIPAASPTLEVLPAALAEHDLAAAALSSGQSPFVRLEGDWASFYRGRSRRLKKGNNLAANRLRRNGDLNLEWVRADDVGERDIDALLQAMTHVSARSWKEQIGLSLDKPGPGAFIGNLTRHAHRNGWLSIWLLMLDGRAIASEYQLVYDHQVYALRADFDEGYRELSPGAYLNWKMLERLFPSGLRCYHMGPGGNPYKLRWTADSQSLCRVVAYSPTWRGYTMSLLALKLRPQIKRLAGITRGNSNKPRGTP